MVDPNQLFNTPEKAERAVADFQSVQEHPGWKLFAAIVDANIEELRRQLEEGTGEGETAEDIRVARKLLSFAKDMRNTPASMIAKLQSSEAGIPDSDPFDTVEALQKRRQEAGSSPV